MLYYIIPYITWANIFLKPFRCDNIRVDLAAGIREALINLESHKNKFN